MALTQINPALFAGATNTTAVIQSNGTTAITVDSSQNVGIGTASPATKLDVVNTQSSGTGAVTTVRLNHSGTTAGDGPRLLFTSGASTTGGCAIAGSGVALNSADMLFYTGGNTERMRIDASGRITTPYQPTFYGYRTAGNVGSPVTVLHNVVLTNIGSCYNSSTGIFTCPVAGYYEVMVGGHGENSQPVVLQIQQNGTTIAEEYSNGAAYASVTAFAIISCAVNDQIKSVVNTGTMWGGNISGLRMSVKLVA